MEPSLNFTSPYPLEPTHPYFYPIYLTADGTDNHSQVQKVACEALSSHPMSNLHEQVWSSIVNRLEMYLKYVSNPEEASRQASYLRMWYLHLHSLPSNYPSTIERENIQITIQNILNKHGLLLQSMPQTEPMEQPLFPNSPVQDEPKKNTTKRRELKQRIWHYQGYTINETFEGRSRNTESAISIEGQVIAIRHFHGLFATCSPPLVGLDNLLYRITECHHNILEMAKEIAIPREILCKVLSDDQTLLKRIFHHQKKY